MKITKEWLKKQNACKPGYDWFIRQYDTDHELVIASLMKIDRFDWANWLIVRLMDKAQKVKYACHAARLVLPIYEEYKPGDDRPRKAIEAAESGDAARAATAANAAAAAAYDAYDAAAAAYDAAAAAYAAATAAATAAYAAYAYAAAAAYDAATAAAYAYDAATETKTKIINYGLSLIK